jgi:putative nucleotidyltransferase with HDIG domain
MIPFERLVARVEAIPPLSPAALQALEALDREDVSATEIERIIRFDPVLSATFLRLANAACFGHSGAIDTLRGAITRLGWTRVRHVVSAAAFARVIPPRIPGYDMDALAFWAHCAATALLTESLYEELRLPEPPVAFVAAILHDIGRLALGVFIEELASEIAEQVVDSEASFEEIERRVIGVDHATLGLRLASAWHLPPGIAHACSDHHDPSCAPPEFRQMIEIIHMADQLAYTMGFGVDVPGLRHDLHPASPHHSPLTDTQAQRVMDRVRDDIRDLVHVAPLAC